MIGRKISVTAALIARAACSLFVPRLCIGCERQLELTERWICRTCLLQLLMNSAVSLRVLRVGKKDVLARYVLNYTPLVARLITDFKYCDRPGLAGLLSQLVFAKLKALLIGNAILVAVPMHPAKLRERGYNQSELLCRELSRLSGLSFMPNVLIKQAQTCPQARLPRQDRMRNLRGKITCRLDAPISGKRFIVVDDVMTTGATLRECAGVLLANGAREVSACVIASSL